MAGCSFQESHKHMICSTDTNTQTHAHTHSHKLYINAVGRRWLSIPVGAYVIPKREP